MTDTTNASRATDAHLHELLFGVKCEWRASYRDPETGHWVEEQSSFEREQTDPIRREMQQLQLVAIIQAAQNNENCGIQHGLQPCAPRILNDDLSSNWQAPFVDWAYEVIPHYSTDNNDIARAELALAPELREDYASELLPMLTDRSNRLINYSSSSPSLNYTTLYALITATAAQRALALVAVLERVRGEVGQS